VDVKFYLKNKNKQKTSIDAKVYFKGVRYVYSPGVSVEVEYWQGNSAEESADYTEGQIINIVLNDAKVAIIKILNNHLKANTRPTQAQFKADVYAELHPDEIQQIDTELFTSYFKNYAETSNLDTQTRKNYNSCYNFLVKYENAFKQKLTFETIGLDFYDSFRRWFLKQAYIPQKGGKPQPYSLNYFGSIVKCIKAVMETTGPAHRLKIHNSTEYKSKDFKKDEETADSIYLNIEELQKIHKFTPTIENINQLVKQTATADSRGRKVKSLTIVKNKFLIGSFTALRVSDFNRLSEVNLSENFIRIKPHKGKGKNEDVVIPIHPVVREILESGFDIATPLSEQKINKHIKEICQLVGIVEDVVISRTEGGRLVERIYKKYEKVTSHTARRSGATNMYLAGIPTISIMKITGHRTERSFLKYIRITQEENARLLANHPFFKG